MSSLEINNPAAREAAGRLIRAGYQVFMAGGAARDLVRGRRPQDYDIATSAPAAKIREIFPDFTVRETGRAFRVLLIGGVEVSPFRCEASFGPDGSLDAPGASIEEDLALRDLTINSMAVNAATGELVDPFGGTKDLAARVIRFTGDPAARLAEDPCRAVRACRFLALLAGEFAPETLAALKELGPDATARTAPERLRLEILKAMRIRKASPFFRSLLEIGALKHIFPSLAATAGHDGGPNHIDDVFTHGMLAGDAMPTRCPLLKLTAYIHDSGKPRAASIVDGRLKFIGHEKDSEELVAPELASLCFSRAEQRTMLSMIRHHMHGYTPDATPRAARRLLSRLAQDNVSYMSFLRMRVADRGANRAKGPYDFARIRYMLGLLESQAFPSTGSAALRITDLAVDGREVMRELGLPPGPEVGKVLAELLARVVEDPDLNTREDLLRMIRENQ